MGSLRRRPPPDAPHGGGTAAGGAAASGAGGAGGALGTAPIGGSGGGGGGAAAAGTLWGGGLASDGKALEEAAQHAELVLSAQVSGGALAALVRGILERRGPMPVGEVGKLLQEATGNAALAAALKERYGGLKRFLQAQPSFVVHLNHPFNPLVALK